MVPVLSREKQSKIVLKLKTLEQNIENLIQYSSSSKALQKSLINQIF
jgi:restriction endonuclease S subunit